jgi:hypothetical protein
MAKVAKNAGRRHMGIFPVQAPVFDRAMHLDGQEDERRAAGEILRVRPKVQNHTLAGVAGRVWTPFLRYSTTIEPFILGWNSQKYSNVPAASKACVNDSPGAMAPD